MAPVAASLVTPLVVAMGGVLTLSLCDLLGSPSGGCTSLGPLHTPTSDLEDGGGGKGGRAPGARSFLRSKVDEGEALSEVAMINGEPGLSQNRRGSGSPSEGLGERLCTPLADREASRRCREAGDFERGSA